MDVRVRPWGRQSTKELMLLNCGPLDSKEIKPVKPKENQSWIFVGRPDAEAAVLWQLDAKSRLLWKDPDAGKDWRQEEKGMMEDEMVGWHHWLNGHEFEATLVDGEGQGSLVCCSPSGCKESDMTEQLNNKVRETMNGILKYKWKTNTSKNNDVDLGKNQIQVLEKYLA